MDADRQLAGQFFRQLAKQLYRQLARQLLSSSQDHEHGRASPVPAGQPKGVLHSTGGYLVGAALTFK